VCANGNASLYRFGERAGDELRVARMNSARHVARRDQWQKLPIALDTHLAYVAVEVNSLEHYSLLTHRYHNAVFQLLVVEHAERCVLGELLCVERGTVAAKDNFVIFDGDAKLMDAVAQSLANAAADDFAKPGCCAIRIAAYVVHFFSALVESLWVGAVGTAPAELLAAWR